MEIISGSVDFKSGNHDRVITTNDNLNILPEIGWNIKSAILPIFIPLEFKNSASNKLGNRSKVAWSVVS